MDYGKLYDEFYYKTSCGNVSYLESEKWFPFYEGIADKIVKDINPSTVLDVGCAVGYLVAALRDRGVEAYGIDISEFAISKVREDIRPYCAVWSAIEPLPQTLPQKYDLLITIEVAEHLYEEDAPKFIENICKYSDKIIFSSTPDDIIEETHFNVQQAEYWAKRFARNKFFKELTYDTSYIASQACLFAKSEIAVDRLVENYERNTRVNKLKIQQIQRDYKDSSYISTLFLDYGDGFSENASIAKTSTEFEFYNEYEIAANVKSIRFDPVEGKASIVYNLEIISNNGQLKAQNLNGIKIDNFNIFTSKDPQLLIDFNNKPTSWIRIKATIIPFESMAMYVLLSKFFKANTEKQKIGAELEEILSENSAVLDERAELLAEIKAKEAEIVAKEAEIDELLRMEETKELLLAVAEEKEKELLKRLEQKDEALTVVQNTIEEGLQKLESKDKIIKDYDEKCTNLKSQLEKYKTHYIAAINQRDDLARQLAENKGAYRLISNSTSWKITKPIRKVMDLLKRLLKSNRFTHNICKGIRSLKQHGVKCTWGKVRRKLSTKGRERNYFKINNLSEAEKENQKSTVFDKNIKFSIVVPLYNTPDRFLIEMIESVIAQTYSNWELCLADGSDNKNNIKSLSINYMKKNKNIKYKKIYKNLGISGNTIEAFQLATGEYIVLLDHDDILAEDALYELACCIDKNPTADFIYSDRGIFSDETRRILAYHYLPAYSPEFMRACNYASHLNAFSRYIINEVGFIRPGYDGSQDYEFELRVVEKARKVVNIPRVLYYCRACEGSVALNPESKMYAYEAGRKAIEEHIGRIGYHGNVEFLKETFSYRIHYNIKKQDKVSIIIPNKDHVNTLKRCIDSIVIKTDYNNYEIIVVENNSIEKETFEYYQAISKNEKINILYYGNDGFNYSAINNFAVKEIDSPYVLFLNNDIKVINSNWLTEMLMFAQRSDVGAVGAKLYYPNDTFQHIGLFIGLGGHIASHYDHKKSRFETGYMNRLSMPQNYNAITAACLLMKREDFIKVEGFDDVNFKVGLNDIDLCLKLREIGKMNVLTPYAELYHYESITRGFDVKGESKIRFEKECKMFRAKWKKYFDEVDEYTNPNFSCEVVQ